MLDPIGGFNRIKKFMIRQIETSQKIKDPEAREKRHKLLENVGVLAAEPVLETILRYTPADYTLENYIDLPDDKNPVAHFSKNGQKAFVELALSGLFEGQVCSGEIQRKSLYAPYTHQEEMLRRGCSSGQPAIVTSGTGSGKTESFMLPILATLANEAVNWKKLKNPCASTWFKEKGGTFEAQRVHEERPAAIRALLLYPMNALVEDQMTRLRRALDSEMAQKVMLKHFHNNRIYFGQYTGKSIPTGFCKHPRIQFAEGELLKKITAQTKTRHNKLREYLQQVEKMHNEAVVQDLRDNNAESDKVAYLFPKVGYSELISRWDMQCTPPDILISNISMLSTMLAREVEKPIFTSTKKWLESDPDAYFFLVLDEMHLIRGAAGSEISGLIKTLLYRLGLHRPEHRHKLRILASSASLPSNDTKSLKYLHDFFGKNGTYLPNGTSTIESVSDWEESIISGEQQHLDIVRDFDIPQKPFIDFACSFSKEEGFVNTICKEDIETHMEILKKIANALNLQCNDSELVEQLIIISARILYSASIENGGKLRARSANELLEQIFGTQANMDALRGLVILRGLSDIWKVRTLLPSIRIHTFFRNLQGLYAMPVQEHEQAQEKIRWASMTCSYGKLTGIDEETGSRGRLFELV